MSPKKETARSWEVHEAHGYKQKEGLDYVETFAAVVKPKKNCASTKEFLNGKRVLQVHLFFHGYLKCKYDLTLEH